MVKLVRGKFDGQLGKINIVLRSSFAAAEFYNAFSKAKDVLELIIDMNWACTQSDLDELEDTLKKSRVSILRLNLQRFRISLSDRLLSTSIQHKALFRLRELSLSDSNQKHPLIFAHYPSSWTLDLEQLEKKN